MIDRWKSQAVTLLPPATRQEVLDTFAAIGSDVTSDVIQLYMLVGGMPDMDQDYWCLWSLDQIRRENEEVSAFGVQFSDYMIDCWRYRLKPNSNDTSSILVDYFDGTDPTVVAESVAEFFELYAAEPMQFLNCRSLKESRRHVASIT